MLPVGEKCVIYNKVGVSDCPIVQLKNPDTVKQVKPV